VRLSSRERTTKRGRKGWCCAVSSAPALVPASSAGPETKGHCTCSARSCCCCCLCSLRNCCFCCSITWSWALCSISICFMMAAWGWFPRKGPPELVPVTTLLEPGGTEGCIGPVVRDKPTWCCSCAKRERRPRYSGCSMGKRTYSSLPRSAGSVGEDWSLEASTSLWKAAHAHAAGCSPPGAGGRFLSAPGVQSLLR